MARQAAQDLLDAGFLPIPSKEKRPAVAHKPRPGGGGPLWTREVARRNMHLFDTYRELGVLCDNGVVVIDFDDVTTYDAWRADGLGSVFDATVLAKTRKGFHVWFRRSALCDQLDLFDGPTGFRIDADGRKIKNPIDVKTITRATTTVTVDNAEHVYHTPGFCSTWPSANKSWINSPFDFVLQPLPESLLTRLLKLRNQNASQRSAFTKPLRALRYRPPRVESTFWRPRMLDCACLAAMGFPADDMQDVLEYETMNDDMKNARYVGGTMQFKLKEGVPCPLCFEPKGHHNSYWVGHMADGTRRIRSNSRSCTAVAQMIPWTPAGQAAWMQDMRSIGTPASSRTMETFENQYSWFTQARDGFFFERTTFVFASNQGYGVIRFGLNALVGGYPRARLTTMPWVDDFLDSWVVPIPPLFFQTLERANAEE